MDKNCSKLVILESDKINHSAYDFSKYSSSELEEMLKTFDKSKSTLEFKAILHEIDNRAKSRKAKKLLKIYRNSNIQTEKMFALTEYNLLIGKFKKLTALKKYLLYLFLWFLSSLVFVLVSPNNGYLTDSFYENPTGVEKLISSFFWMGIHLSFIIILVYYRKKAFFKRHNL